MSSARSLVPTGRGCCLLGWLAPRKGRERWAPRGFLLDREVGRSCRLGSLGKALPPQVSPSTVANLDTVGGFQET